MHLLDQYVRHDINMMFRVETDVGYRALLTTMINEQMESEINMN